MLFDDPQQKEIYRQWLAEYVEKRIAQFQEDIKKRNPSISEDGAVSLFLMSLPSVPDKFRELTEQIFLWHITATQFIAIQKSLDLTLYPRWIEGERWNKYNFYIFIGEEEVSLVEREFPELKKGTAYCKEIIDALDLLEDSTDIYDAAQHFLGLAPAEIVGMRCRIFKLYKYFCDVDEVAPEQNETPPARGGLARYVESLYAEGKTTQEIAVILKGKGLSRPEIGVLLREEDGFVGNYGKWLDAKGWLSQKPKE